MNDSIPPQCTEWENSGRRRVQQSSYPRLFHKRCLKRYNVLQDEHAKPEAMQPAH